MIALRQRMTLVDHVDAAFSWVSSAGRAARWEPHTIYVEPMDHGRPQVGQQQYLVAHRVFGRTLTLLYTLERLDPGKDVVFAVHRTGSTVRISFTFDHMPIPSLSCHRTSYRHRRLPRQLPPQQ